MSSGDNGDVEINGWMNDYSDFIKEKINMLREKGIKEEEEEYTEEQLQSIANTLKIKEGLDDMLANTTNASNPPTGGKPTKQTKPTITGKKEILGKQRCIYKKTGDRKEYVKYKGDLITVKDYKKIISVKKTKNNK